VIAGLTAGGAERVLVTMANHWVAEGRPVSLITMSTVERDFYALDPRVRRVALGVQSASRHVGDAVINNAGRWWRLRKAILGSPGSVVISFGESVSVLCLIAAIGTGRGVVACERNDPRQHSIGRAWGLARRIAYRRAARVVVQTDGVRSWAVTIVRPSGVVVIPNPAPSECPPASPDGEGGRLSVIGAGRLVDQKGFDTLVRAFAQVAPNEPAWDLVIVGDGPLRDPLLSLAHELGISDRLSLPGVVPDLAHRMAGGGLFVLSSRYEGFPNVLLEAMSCGMAVIATDCPSGPSEIVRDGHDGILVPVDDVPEMGRAMARLMGDARERVRLGNNAVEVRERFSMASVMSRWDQVIDAVFDRA
jgi:glycosyltransferase involved in cell wall biosynthesis